MDGAVIVTALIDVDGVLMDLATPVWQAAQDTLSKALPPPSEWSEYDFAKAMGLTQSQATRLYNVLRKRDSLASLTQWYPGAIEFIHELLRHGYDVCFVTMPWEGISSWQKDRRRQLLDQFPEQEIMFTAYKRRVIGHYLLDDCVDHIRHNRARGMLFDQPWNRGPEARSFRRIRGYDHALKYILFGELHEDTEIITELGCGEVSGETPTATTTKRAGASR
jgi:5'(3')-deoxyribonucleotidase